MERRTSMLECSLLAECLSYPLRLASFPLKKTGLRSRRKGKVM